MYNEDEDFENYNQTSTEKSQRENDTEKNDETEINEVDPYPLPTNQDYMSYYVYQNEWRPTKPLRPIIAMWGNPGPGIVNLPPTIGEEGHDPTKAKAPGYKIGTKNRYGRDSKESRSGPGPGKYNTQGVTNMGKDSSKGVTIGTAHRFRDRNKRGRLLPGPATYSKEDSDRALYRHCPAFSMPQSRRGGGSGGHLSRTTTPAPNAYTMPTAFGPGKTPLTKGPAFSIGKSRRDEFYSKPQSPGPATYILPPNDVFLNKSPAFHMASKSRPPTGGATYTPKPGPHAAHLVKFDKYSTPRITFGIRHSPYKVLPGFAAEK